MYQLMDTIERLRTYPTKEEISLTKEILEEIKVSKEYAMLVEIAESDGNIDLQAVKNLIYGYKENKTNGRPR